MNTVSYFIHITCQYCCLNFYPGYTSDATLYCFIDTMPQYYHFMLYVIYYCIYSVTFLHAGSFHGANGVACCPAL